MSNLELIDTTTLEALARDYVSVQQNFPTELMLSEDLNEITHDLFEPVFNESVRVLGGVIVYFESHYVAPLDDRGTLRPVTSLTYGETSGVGKLVDVVPCLDFTKSAQKAGSPKSTSCILPGLIFATDDEYQELIIPDSLGVSQLFPYCAIPIGVNNSRFEANPFGRLNFGQPT